MQLDLTGRVPLFFVADGTYHVRLIDQFGVQQFDYPQIPSIGASSSGGGGTPVDPTTVFQTGDVIWVDVSGLRSGWVRDNGRTIGSATSGATERANADTQSLFIFLWTNFTDAQCPVGGGRGVSGLADFSANKQITLPDKKGTGVVGLADMGAADSGRLASVPFVSGNATTAGSVLGENLHINTTAEIPAHNHTINITDPGHAHTKNVGTAAGFSAADIEANGVTGTRTDIVLPAFTGITAASVNTGGGTAHNNVQRGILGTFYRKL